MLTIKFPESCVNFIAYDSRRGRVTKLTFCFNICKSKFEMIFLPISIVLKRSGPLKQQKAESCQFPTFRLEK